MLPSRDTISESPENSVVQYFFDPASKMPMTVLPTSDHLPQASEAR
jgi:hypothetical protein